LNFNNENLPICTKRSICGLGQNLEQQEFVSKLLPGHLAPRGHVLLRVLIPRSHDVEHSLQLDQVLQSKVNR